MGVNIINNFPPGLAGSGGYVSPVPEFSFTGQYQMLDDGSGDWRLKLLTSGVLTFLGTGDLLVDIFLVGGGGGGNSRVQSGSPGYYYPAGGGGGITLTASAQILTQKTDFTVAIGSGGTGTLQDNQSAIAGGDTSFGAYSARGGQPGKNGFGGGGGSGGGSGYGAGGAKYKLGGIDGASGETDSSGYAGRGQGSTTREFAEPDGKLYSNGGSADHYNRNVQPYNETNMGHGGHGISQYYAPEANQVNGQPGVVIIRNHRRAA